MKYFFLLKTVQYIEYQYFDNLDKQDKRARKLLLSQEFNNNQRFNYHFHDPLPHGLHTSHY